MHKLARVSYNSDGWQRPTGEAKKYESKGTYNYLNGFGHEDWLLEGWHYAFLEGVKKSRVKLLGRTLDLTLFTIEPVKKHKKRRYVANINALECLSDEQAEDALNAFRQKGWLQIMKKEVAQIGGNVTALDDPKWAKYILNVRFRRENVAEFPPESYVEDEAWLKKRNRYLLLTFPEADRKDADTALRGRRGQQTPPDLGLFTRRGTAALEYTPEHRKMQAKLLSELQSEFGFENVQIEENFIDASVRTKNELILYEIKTDLEPRAVIRSAVGQILEYAYYPSMPHKLRVRLVIVGRCGLGANEEAYLKRLRTKFSLPLEYKVVTL